MEPLRRAVQQRRVKVVTHQLAFDELRRVLGYRALKLDIRRQEQVLADYEAQTSACDAALLTERAILPERFPRCRDPDDDHFLALAYRARAGAVVSRDRAVLKVGKRCHAFGFTTLAVQAMIAALSP